MIPRPDELASQSQIELEEKFRKNIKNVGSAAVGAIGGIGSAAVLPKAIEKLTPFFSKYVPVDLAIKGISKINPKIGSFLKKGMDSGLDIKDGFEFLKNKMQEASQQEPAKENRNIIEQYSPELNKFLQDQISKGRSPIEAAALAQNDKKYADVIKKISKDHKTNWSNIIQSIFGNGQTAQPQAQQTQQQPQTQGPGPGQQALMEVLQRINQKLGK